MTEINPMNDGHESLYNNLGKIDYNSPWSFANLSRYMIAGTQIYNWHSEFNKDKNQIKILDIGASSATFYKFLRNNFSSFNRPRIDYTGLEYRQSSVDDGNKFFDSIKSDVNKGHIFQCDLNIESNYSFLKDQKFDIVLCQEIIEHISKDSGLKLLNFISTILSENGILILSTPNPPKKEFSKQETENFDFMFPEDHIYEYNYNEMKNILIQNFDIKESFGWNCKIRRIKSHVSFADYETYKKLKKISDGFANTFLATYYPEYATCYMFIVSRKSNELHLF